MSLYIYSIACSPREESHSPTIYRDKRKKSRKNNVRQRALALRQRRNARPRVERKKDAWLRLGWLGGTARAFPLCERPAGKARRAKKTSCASLSLSLSFSLGTLYALPDLAGRFNCVCHFVYPCAGASLRGRKFVCVKPATRRALRQVVASFCVNGTESLVRAILLFLLLLLLLLWFRRSIRVGCDGQILWSKEERVGSFSVLE